MKPDSVIDDGPLSASKRTVDDPYIGTEEKDHFAAIGLVANEWAWLEFKLDLYTIEMLEFIEDRATCLIAQVAGSARKLDAYISASRLRGVSNAGKPLEKFAQETAKLAETRNRIIHDSWIVPKAPHLPHRFEMTARKTVRKGSQKTSTIEVLKLAIKIIEHSERLDVIHADHLDELRTSPAGSP